MIDTRFIQAQRRAARTAGEASASGSVRQRRNLRSGRGGPVESPGSPTIAARPVLSSEEGKNNQSDSLFTDVSPPTRPIIRPPDSGANDDMGSLALATSNLSIQAHTQVEIPAPSSRGGSRGRRRGRPNRSKRGSPQRSFQPRTSSEELHIDMNRLMLSPRNEMSPPDQPQRGTIPAHLPLEIVETSAKANQNISNIPAVPISTGSHETSNLVRSEDTDFGSDITRGVVQEGKLYNHKNTEKPGVAKGSEQSKLKKDKDMLAPNSESSQPGLLRIHPHKSDTGNQQQRHRGGLLLIGSAAIKSTPSNVKAPKGRGEYSRIAPVKEDNQSVSLWNPDNIPPRLTTTGVVYDKPKVVLSAEDILREVKTAHQEIQAIEGRLTSIYEQPEDGIDLSRNQSRTSFPNNPGEYCKIHREYSPYLASANRRLLEVFHTFFIMSQHPSASSTVRRLARRHDMLSRYWRNGIVQLLEHLRLRLPSTEAHMESFIFMAYTLTGVLLQDVPTFQRTWMECLGGLAQYLYEVEEIDLERKDHWKDLASQWYWKAIYLDGGTEGRLFHHLGTLNNSDLLSQMYYFAKSLTVRHGFIGARESLIAMVDPVLHTRPANWRTCFVKLCGIIFTQSQVDLFDNVLDQFWNSLDDDPPSQVQWGQMAITTVTALYQFNCKKYLFHEALGGRKRATIDKFAPLEELHSGEQFLPTSQADQMGHHWDFDSRQLEHLPNTSDVFNPDEAKTTSVSGITFEQSCKLAFGLLSEVLRGFDHVNSIFLHIWLVFLLSIASHPPLLKLLEPNVPWQELAQILNQLKTELEDNWEKPVSLEQLAKMEIAGPILLEDLIIPGLEWSERPFPQEALENVDLMEMSLTKDTGVRRGRILCLGIQLTKVCDCLEIADREPFLFRTSDALAMRVAEAEAKDSEASDGLQQTVEAFGQQPLDDPIVTEGENQGDVNSLDERQFLSARRRELKTQLKAQRPEPHIVHSSKLSRKDKAGRQTMKSTYTILVFDTSILVLELDLLKQAVQTREWQIVVPLIVVNELDTLKANLPPLGPAAFEALSVIEQALLSKRVRVITQQGNGLSNLAGRSQQLLSRNTEDGIDALVIQVVQDQADRHSGRIPSVEKAVLVTGDQDIKDYAKSRGVHAVSGCDLEKMFFAKGAKGEEARSKNV